jgi:cobalt/nickel transport system permease protein
LKHSPVDRFAYKKSLIHLLPLSIKGPLFFLPIIVNSLPFNFYFLPLCFIILSLILFKVAGIPLKFVLKRVLMVFPFLVLVLFMAPPHKLTFFLKILSSLLFLLLFFTTTPFLSLMRGMERIGIPRLFILLTAFGYRYFFLLTDEAERAVRAWRIKGGDLKKFRFADVSRMVLSIFLRSMKRAERIGNVMRMRGLYEENN